MRKSDYPEYANSKMECIIDEHIHSADKREILKLSLLHELTYEKIAEKVDCSPGKVKNIVYKCTDIVFRHYKEEL